MLNPSELLLRSTNSALDISTLFSTDLYTGNGSTQTITNGNDLSGEGGLVWLKQRSSSNGHSLWDSERGLTKYLKSQDTSAQSTFDIGLSFNSDGFSFNVNDALVNFSLATYVSWTFRKSPNFFDVVTYTGNGTAGRTISHNLGVTPGVIVVKRYNTTTAWAVYHRSTGATKWLELNSTGAEQTGTFLWNDTEPTSSEFTVGGNSRVNSSGSSYVAYLFAHDTTDNGVIQCGSYTGNGSTSGPTVTLGWEPQWVMIKRADSAGDWWMLDNQRGFSTSGSGDALLAAQSSSAELSAGTYVNRLSTGFQPATSGTAFNASGGDYIYMAVRAEGV